MVQNPPTESTTKQIVEGFRPSGSVEGSKRKNMVAAAVYEKILVLFVQYNIQCSLINVHKKLDLVVCHL